MFYRFTLCRHLDFGGFLSSPHATAQRASSIFQFRAYIEIYKTDNKQDITNKKDYLEITNAEEIIHLLTYDKQLLEKKIQVISPQIIFQA